MDPDLETVLDALTSEPCRDVLRSLDGPLTAAAVAERCGISESTAHRALERLVAAGLLRKRERTDAATYGIDFEEVVVRTADGDLDLEVAEPSRSAAEQLSALWADVQAEAGGGE